MQYPILIISDRDNRSFSVIEHLYSNALKKLGYQVTAVPQPSNDNELESLENNGIKYIVFHNRIGPNFSPIQNCINIALPVHEWSKYPKNWAEKLVRFDEVWVTTEHVETLLLATGVKLNIKRLPPPLDLEPIPIKNWDHSGDGTRFYFCGASHFRKALHLLIAGFERAFPEPGFSTLTLKTDSKLKWKSQRKDIRIIKEEWTRKDCLEAYRNYDCYVSASLGEGLGLPVAEAILSGIPVATNYWGGHKSLLTPGAFFEIEHREIIQPYASRPDFFVSGQRCAFSDVDYISKAFIRAARSNREEKQAIAALARNYLLKSYSAANCLRAIELSLRKL